MADCWSCGAERGRAVLCTSCGLIQPVPEGLDYFRALELERRMRLGRDELDRAFRVASKKVHPDRFPRTEPKQRKLALAHTELVNEAYQTLKDPQRRAEYLLELEGLEVASEVERTEDPAFLLALLEKQEAVQMAAEDAELQIIKAETKARSDALFASLEGYFEEGEGEQQQARKALIELRYLRRMLEQISAKEEELF